MAKPASPLHTRLAEGPSPSAQLVARTVEEVGNARTILVDGGRTLLAVVEALPAFDDRLIVTPSPWVAITCQKIGLAVFLLGGLLRSQGGIATGDAAYDRLANLAADVALLGACGVDPDFGLSSDDHDEAMMKKAMSRSAKRTIVVTANTKIGRRARHHTLKLSDIDLIMTDTHNPATTALESAFKNLIISE